jgi:hypothetical protein
MLCVVSGTIAFLLFVFAMWLNADVRMQQYFLQLAAVLLSGLLFGVFMGCGFSALLHVLRWHKATRLKDDQNRTIVGEKSHFTHYLQSRSFPVSNLCYGLVK